MTHLLHAHNEEMKKFAKTYFEQNYLDGDEIQEGQMLASSECFSAIMEALFVSHKSLYKKLLQREIDAINECTPKHITREYRDTDAMRDALTTRLTAELSELDKDTN